MTKQEAIEAMLNGSKVTHPNITDYLIMDSGIVYNSNLREIFFEYWTGTFEDNWSIYRMTESEKMWVESF